MAAEDIINKLFNNPLYSDVVFFFGNKKFYGHKFILKPRSKYFFAMLESSFLENNISTIFIPNKKQKEGLEKVENIENSITDDSDQPCFEEENWDPENFEWVVQVMYYCNVTWSSKSLEDLFQILTIGQYLMVESVIKQCDRELCLRLPSYLTPHSCFNYLNIAKRYQLYLLATQLQTYMKQNACEICNVCSKEDILGLSKEDFEHLVLYCCANSFDLDKRISLLELYIQHDIEHRSELLGHFLKPLLPQLSFQKLLNVSSWVHDLSPIPQLRPNIQQVLEDIHNEFCSKIRHLEHNIRLMPTLHLQNEDGTSKEVVSKEDLNSLFRS